MIVCSGIRDGRETRYKDHIYWRVGICDCDLYIRGKTEETQQGELASDLRSDSFAEYAVAKLRERHLVWESSSTSSSQALIQLYFGRQLLVLLMLGSSNKRR
jgi:hypothetical protein